MLNCSIKRKKRTPASSAMEVFDNVLLNASDFIKGRLYFVSLNTHVDPKSTPSVHYFTVDHELEYESFYLDFGPLNLAMLYHYCLILRRKLSNPTFQNKKIVHYTYGPDGQRRVNAAFLIGAYSIIYLNYEPNQVFEILNHDSAINYFEFRDASIGEPYTLGLLDCLKAVKKATTYGFFNFDDFDFLEYEHYERVENGDFNWILPNKFIAFCGPQDRTRSSIYFHIQKPETYFAYFRRHKVSTIVRLNKKAYDSNKFVQAGFEHKDLYFVDGGTPSDRILDQFITLSENAKGAVAVHCKAGLGRTGSLIACYIMKHYKFTAEEAIAWIRICRPGSIIGHQQSWLQEKQKEMWDAGDLYRKKHGISEIKKLESGIYSLSDVKKEKKNSDNVTGIMKKVDCMDIRDPEEGSEENKITQGDKLNQIKAQRSRAKPLATSQTERLRRVNTLNSPITQTVLRGGKIICSTPSKMPSSATNRVTPKRIDPQPLKRVSTRRLVSPITSPAEKLQIGEKRPLTKKVPLGRNLKNGLGSTNGATLRSTPTEEKKTKRSKRSLASDKDKASPRSVKVLRRSHVLALSFKECEKHESKLRLPSVKLNKTLNNRR
ncbi:unnamed protein product [Phaedon cochleariae]|uniref:protein-tyrosine-phosphatase n=1 Tax=Phaedon cochleariae TaxID=80249 RepID=A0A9P0DNX8_PHACE|nr:unnamed protein product [Phaedon cochleariae]